MRTRGLVCAGILVWSGAGALMATPIIDKDNPNRIVNEYIVTLKSDSVGMGLTAEDFVGQQAMRFTESYGIIVVHPYTEVMKGFAIRAQDDQIEALALDSSVERIEANKRVRINATQSSATWGLDRIDARSGKDGIYTYTSTGKGVHAYIIDTGTRTTHNEFKSRVGAGFSSVDDNRGPVDCNGHGTHVSATIGGTTYGVAKSVTIHPVRVLGCDGSGDDAGVIAGIDWVAKNAIKPAVANMSLGGDISAALDDSVRNAIKAGVIFVVAAGNENTSACKSSPANVGEALTIGATTSSDARASFSNYGNCVDIFAPGQGITSAWLSSDTATNTISGTSMASPHVAGVVALYLELNPKATPSQIDALVKKNATPSIVKSPGTGSPNLFIYTNPESTTAMFGAEL